MLHNLIELANIETLKSVGCSLGGEARATLAATYQWFKSVDEDIIVE